MSKPTVTPLTAEEELSALAGWLEWASTRYAGIPSPNIVRWAEERIATLDAARTDSLDVLRALDEECAKHGDEPEDDSWEPGVGSAQIKADSDAQEARMDALAAKRAARKGTEDYDDHIRQWLEDFIDYGVAVGKFATVDDAPSIDAYFETLDDAAEARPETVLGGHYAYGEVEGKVLPQGQAVVIEGVPPIRGKHG